MGVYIALKVVWYIVCVIFLCSLHYPHCVWQGLSQQVSERFFRAKMINPDAPGRLDLLQQEVKKIKEFIMNSEKDNLVSTMEQISKKQDKTEQILAILMEGQAKIIEMGIHTENVPRKG